MDIETALKEEIRLQDEKAKAAISGKSRSELVEYAKSYVDESQNNLNESFLNQSFSGFLKNREPPREILALAREDGNSYEALRRVVTRLRRSGHPVPADIKDFVLDIELGVLKPPRKKGSKVSARNRQICECISYIVRFSKFTAQRSPGSNRTDCAVAILADALSRSYDTIEEIWKDRNKAIHGGKF